MTTRRAYYNECDRFAAAWLRALIAEGLIADGDVDTRSIADVRAADLRGFRQCHFFAGIGGWSYALRRAGWPDARPVWTGSCPCQPWSNAGRGARTDDSRHLWPAWLRLIGECRPCTIFGEQVASADGRAWLDVVSTDMEALEYAIGSCDLPAASVGAPHRRQRLWFVAHTDGAGRAQQRAARLHADRASGHDAARRGASELLGDADRARLQGQTLRWLGADERAAGPTGLVDASGWSAAAWLPARDGKSRPVEPGTFPLADGIPGRVGRLRGYGNAIVPHVAALFIHAFLTREES